MDDRRKLTPEELTEMFREIFERQHPEDYELAGAVPVSQVEDFTKEGEDVNHEVILEVLSKALGLVRAIPEVSNVIIVGNLEGQGLVAYTNKPDPAFLRDIAMNLIFADAEDFQRVDRDVDFGEN